MTPSMIVICALMSMVILVVLVVAALQKPTPLSSNDVHTQTTPKLIIAATTAKMDSMTKRTKLVRVCRLPTYYFTLNTPQRTLFLALVLQNYYGPWVDISLITRGFQELPNGDKWVLAEDRNEYNGTTCASI